MTLDIEGVLAGHVLTNSFTTIEGFKAATCSCGEPFRVEWMGMRWEVEARLHRAHVAAVLREQIAAWLGSEAERRDPESVWWRIQHYGPLDAAPFEFSRFESPAHAALSALAAQVAPSRVPGEGS